MADISDGLTDADALNFVIKQFLSRVRTCMPVTVLSCTNAGGYSAVGFVDVQPNINQVDGSGGTMPHKPAYNLPYFRIQGGANAIIIDPVAGDQGLACFADRDVTSWKSRKAQSNPGSRRRHSMGDGFYIGGFLNGTPTQFIQFSSAGITLTSPTAVIINAPVVQVNPG